MVKQIFNVIILRLPNEAFIERADYISLKTSRDECNKLSIEDWNEIITDYWNYSDKLKREGRKWELGVLHEEIDRVYDSMKRDRNIEALRKFLNPNKLKEILKKSKIKSSSLEEGSEGFSWLALAGLYVHYNIIVPRDKIVREKLIEQISEAVKNTLEGESGLAKEVFNEVDTLGKCLLNRLIERKYHPEEVYFTDFSAKKYCDKAGNYNPKTQEFINLKYEPEKATYVDKAFDIIYECFNGIFRKDFTYKWEKWNLMAEVDQYFLDLLYYNWLQIPRSNKAKKDSEWSPTFIIKGEKYIPEKIRKDIASSVSKHVNQIKSGLSWIGSYYRNQMIDAGKPTKRFPIVALLQYIEESYDNEELYRCFPATCNRPSCNKDVNPAKDTCPFCGKKFN